MGKSSNARLAHTILTLGIDRRAADCLGQGFWECISVGVSEDIFDRERLTSGLPQTRPLHLQVGKRAETDWFTGEI